MNGFKKKVLVIEDDPQNMILFQDLLEMFGFESISAVNGIEGTDMALSCDPDLILMDIQLPFLDGYGTLKKIRRLQQKFVPVIAVTACTTDREMLIASGFDDFIPKPIDLDQFKRRLEFYSAK